MSTAKNKTNLSKLVIALLIVFQGFIYADPSVIAATLTSVSVQLSDPRPSQTSDYLVTAGGFTTATSIYCIEVDLDTQADGGGSNPNNITTSSSSLDSSTLITAGNWSVDNTTNGTLRITNAAGETPAVQGNIAWGGVTNGDTEGITYYGVITTYTDVNCTGGNEVDTASMAFTYKAGEQIQLTIDPTLTFNCSAVASGQDVQPNIDPGGDSTTVATGASGVNFGTSVTTSANGISAHDIEVSTNASGGYVVYIRHTQQLTNGALDTIANHTGTNAAPTAFPAAGTEAWGYTTDDTDLTQWDASEYAGFTTSNEEVVSNTSTTSGTETTRVGHQVGIAGSTDGGTYQTTILYTIVATY